jgi:hypothetical protein
MEEVAAPGTDPRRETPEEPITNPRMITFASQQPQPVVGSGGVFGLLCHQYFNMARLEAV